MLERYYHIDKATGISIRQLTDGAYRIDTCSISVDGDKLQFEKKVSGISNVDELAKHLPANAIVAINLTGKGVLTRQTELLPKIDSANFSKILPGANIDDFYIQHFVSGENSFVSVVRKKDADQWIGRLQQLNTRPLLLSLDAFPVEMILPQLNIGEPNFHFNGYSIGRNDRLEWIACSKQEQPDNKTVFKIDKEPINAAELLPYAAAFAVVMFGSIPPVNADVQALNNSLSTELENRKLKARGVIALFVVFTLLLINFGVFSWLHSDNNELSAKVGLLSQSTTDRVAIEDKIKEKEFLLRETGWRNNVCKSILVDEVAGLLPEGVYWTSVTVDPTAALNSGSQKSIAFLDQRIRISGTSDQIIAVNEWIARIKSKSWVKSVQLNNYGYSQELNTGQFTIIITY